MSDTYNKQIIPYKTNDILKITIKYQVKDKQSSKNLVFTKVLFWKVLGSEGSQVVENITIQSFLDSFLEKIFKKGFLLLLCKTTRLNSIKIEKQQSSVDNYMYSVLFMETINALSSLKKLCFYLTYDIKNHTISVVYYMTSVVLALLNSKTCLLN